VITLRCTARLLTHLKKTKEAASASVTPSTTRLGDLYANIVQVGRKQLILVVAERSFLPVVIHAAPSATFVSRLGESLAEVLGQLYLDESTIERECASLLASEVTFAKTASRQIVGVLTELSYLLESVAEGGGRDNLQLSLKLGDVPCSPLYKTTIKPRNATQALFAHAPEVVANDWREPAHNDE
jgi:hypothetical protein